MDLPTVHSLITVVAVWLSFALACWCVFTLAFGAVCGASLLDYQVPIWWSCAAATLGGCGALFLGTAWVTLLFLPLAWDEDSTSCAFGPCDTFLGAEAGESW